MEKLPPWLAYCYAPVEFLGMKSFPHDHIGPLGEFPLFCGYEDSIVKYISTFIAFCKKNEFVLKDLMMKCFTINLIDST